MRTHPGAPKLRTVPLCPECGGKHRALSFLRLVEPIEQASGRVTHRGVCPRTTRDIYIEQRTKP